MAREPEELAEMRRTLGAQLAGFRQAAGLTQGQLAKAAFCDRSTVAHIEKGRSRGDERFWTVADELCGADGALRAVFYTWERAKQDHEVRIQRARLAQAQATADALRATVTPQLPHHADLKTTVGEQTTDRGDQIAEQLVKLLCELVGAMNRRQLIQLLGSTAAVFASPVANSLDTEEQERLARAIISPPRVDERVIDHIQSMLQYCKRQQDLLGSRAVLPTALGQQNLVRELLAECPTELRSRLLSVYSDMSTSIGFYFFDLNEFDRAWRSFDQARAAAHDAGNTELGIYALCEMSFAACWQGKAHTAIDTAAAAGSLLVRTDDPLMSVCVADKAAKAYAMDCQHGACMVELEKAHGSLASIEHVPVESPAYWYDDGLLACEKSYCLLRLGKARDAALAASAGLELFDKSYVGSLASCMLFLGNAHLQSGEIEEAARVIGDAAELAARTRSVRLMTELHATRARMQPWQGTQAVSALDDQLRAHGLSVTA